MNHLHDDDDDVVHDDAAERREMEELAALVSDEAEKRDMDTLRRIVDEDDDLPLDDPYRELADALRAEAATDETIWQALTDLAQRRGEDWEEVFGILYGPGSIKGPSEAF